MLTPREKTPLPKMSPEEDRTRDAVDSEPKHYQLSYSGPHSFFCFIDRQPCRSDLQCSRCYRTGRSVEVIWRAPQLGHQHSAAMLADVSRRIPPQKQKVRSSNPACDGIFPGRVIPATYKLALQWIPYQAPGIIGSVLGLVGPVSVYCDWAR